MSPTTAPTRADSRRPRWAPGALLWLTLVLLAVALVAFCVGQYVISLPTVLETLAGRLTGRGGEPSAQQATIETVLFTVRLPRIIAAVLIGAALACAGATFQGLFRNPMVSPDILGATSGAGFGAALGLLLSWNLLGVSGLAFALGGCAVVLTYVISRVISHGDDSILMLVLTGMVVYNLFLAFISITKYVADPDNKLPAITFWLMGGLSTITLSNLGLLLVPLVIGFVPIVALRWRLNVMSFGDEEAKAMGVDTERLRWLFICCATLLTAASVAVSGIIGWVGLVIPHVARIIVGPNFSRLIPASMLCGAAFLLVADGVARSVYAAEIPLGILTSLIGAPFFLVLLIRGRRSAW